MPKKSETAEPAIGDTLHQIATNMARWSNQGAWPMFNPQGESFANFIARVNDYCNSRGMTEVDALQALPLMLPGESRNVLTNVYEELGRNPSWKNVCEKFVQLFYTPEKKAAARAALASIRQDGQSVAQFASRCRQFVSQAYPREKEAREAALETTFIQGLRQELKAAVLRGRHNSFKDMVQAAIAEETILTLVPTANEPILNAVQDLHTSIAAMSLNERRLNKSNGKCPNCERNEQLQRQERPNGSRNYHQRRRRNERNGRPQRRNYVSSLFVPMMIIALVGGSSAETVYHCTGRGGFLARTNEQKCPKTNSMSIAEVTINLVEKNDEPITTTATRCTNETYTECRTYVAFLEVQRISTLVLVAPTKEHDCRELSMNQEWKTRNSEEHQVGERKDHSPTDRPFFGTICHKWSRLTAMRTKVSVIHKSLTSPHFTFTKKCEMRDGKCTNDAALIVWKPIEKKPNCKDMTIIGSFHAILNQHSVVIDTMQLAYEILPRNNTPNEIKECNGEILHPTSSGTFITFPYFPQANNTMTVLQQHRRSKRNVHDTLSKEKPKVLTEYTTKMIKENERIQQNRTEKATNAKLQYAYDKTEQAIKRRFETTAANLCKLAEHQDRLLHAILNINPAAGARAILGRNDISATLIANNTLHITECAKVEIKKTYDDHKLNGTCYLFKPAITMDGKTIFITPEDTHATDHSPTVECSIFKNLTGNVTSIPSWDLETAEHLRRIHFVAGNPYTSLKSLFPMELAIQLGATFDNIQRKSKTILHPIETSSTGKGLKELAHAAGYVIDRATGTIKHVADGISKWYTKYIFWVGLPILGAAILICIVYTGITATLSKFLQPRTINAIANEPSEEEIHLAELYRQQWNKPTMTYIPMQCAVNTAPAKRSLPFIGVFVDDRGHAALWDSGAQISYLRQSCLPPQREKDMKPVTTIANTANGSPIKFIGKIDLLQGG